MMRDLKIWRVDIDPTAKGSTLLARIQKAEAELLSHVGQGSVMTQDRPPGCTTLQLASGVRVVEQYNIMSDTVQVHADVVVRERD